MRAREALRRAKQFVAANYPEHAGDYVEVIRDGSDVPWAWSFGVHVDDEDPRFDPAETNNLIGYVFHDRNNGMPIVQGLY